MSTYRGWPGSVELDVPVVAFVGVQVPVGGAVLLGAQRGRDHGLERRADEGGDARVEPDVDLVAVVLAERRVGVADLGAAGDDDRAAARRPQRDGVGDR